MARSYRSSILFLVFLLFTVNIFFISLLNTVDLPEMKEKKELKVATMNVWNYNTNWRLRLQGIARMIVGEAIDIVTLQEIRSRSSFRDEDQQIYLKTLLSHLPHSVYLPAQQLSPEVDEGLMLFSRYPFADVDSLSLPVGPADTNKRVCLHLNVHLPFDILVSLYATHLSYADTVQCVQVSHLVRFLSSHSRQPVTLALR